MSALRPDSPFPLTTLRDLSCEVVSNEICGNNLLRMRLRALDGGFSCAPGQFIMFDLPEAGFRFRRPFSVLATPSADSFDLYYKVVGYGTKQMAEMKPGSQVRCLGPLGNSFTVSQAPADALYVGGGIGIAPLAFLAEQLQAKGINSGHCFYGVRSHDEIGLGDELASRFGESRLQIATDDGSLGFPGNVVQCLAQSQDLVKQAQTAYVCGPGRMMEAVCHHLFSVNPDIQIQVSLESHMPCGTGACTGCVVPRPEPELPAKVCVEGPVFNARNILWAFPEMPTAPAVCFPSEDSAACP